MSGRSHHELQGADGTSTLLGSTPAAYTKRFGRARLLLTRHRIWEPLLVFLITRLALFGLAVAAQHLILVKPAEYFGDTTAHELVENWVRWDAHFYLDIARSGYGRDGQGVASSAAFFPLYPLATRLVASVIGDVSLAGFFVANAGYALGLLVLYGWAVEKLGRDTALRFTLFLSLSPFAFFFGAVYTESLFLLLAALSFWLAERERWWLSGLAALLCAATRLVGLTLGPALLLLYLSKIGYDRRKIRRNVLAVFLTPGGTLLYMLYLHFQLGDPLAFYHVSVEWARYSVFVDGIADLNPLGFTLDRNNLPHLLNFVAGILGFVATVPVLRVLGPAYAVFVFLGVAIPFSVGLESLGRYVTALFPIFLALAYYSRGTLAPKLIVAVMALMLGLLTVLFVNWYVVV